MIVFNADLGSVLYLCDFRDFGTNGHTPSVSSTQFQPLRVGSVCVFICLFCRLTWPESCKVLGCLQYVLFEIKMFPIHLVSFPLCGCLGTFGPRPNMSGKGSREVSRNEVGASLCRGGA